MKASARKSINLRIAEKEDIPLLRQWLNDIRFIGDYMSFPVQASKNQLEPQVLEHKLYGHEWVDFIVEARALNEIIQLLKEIEIAVDNVSGTIWSAK